MSNAITELEDARKITQLAREYFARQEPTLPFLHFRVESINRNGDPKVWKVRCSFDKSYGSSERLIYDLRVNSETGAFSDVELTE